jgi:hypothetical protein
MGHWWNVKLNIRTDVRRKNLSECHFVHHKHQMNLPGGLKGSSVVGGWCLTEMGRVREERKKEETSPIQFDDSLLLMAQV